MPMICTLPVCLFGENLRPNEPGCVNMTEMLSGDALGVVAGVEAVVFGAAAAAGGGAGAGASTSAACCWSSGVASVSSVSLKVNTTVRDGHLVLSPSTLMMSDLEFVGCPFTATM